LTNFILYCIKDKTFKKFSSYHM